MKPGKGLQRRTPLVAKQPLAAGLPPGRFQPLTATQSLQRSAPLPRAAPKPPKPRERRDGDDRGTPIPRELAAWILERAEGCCDWCGRYCLNSWYSRQHRLPRGAGGRAGAHTAANLVLLCGSSTSPGCHEKAERSDIPAAREAGFRLRDGDDPATIPILRHGVAWVLPGSAGWTPVVLVDGVWIPDGDTMRSA